jgi:hypothetical protein
MAPRSVAALTGTTPRREPAAKDCLMMVVLVAVVAVAVLVALARLVAEQDLPGRLHHAGAALRQGLPTEHLPLVMQRPMVTHLC